MTFENVIAQVVVHVVFTVVGLEYSKGKYIFYMVSCAVCPPNTLAAAS